MNSSLPYPQRIADARRRGSVLILAIVIIVLMVILGATYIQVARVQRLGVTDRRDNLDAIIESVRMEIAEILRRDLVADDGSFFRGDLTQEAPGPDGILGSPDDFPGGGADEYMDYPWTQNTDGTPGSRFYANGINGTIITPPAVGGIWDDTWLSTTRAEAPIAGGGWGHISNLKGYALAYIIGNDDDPTADDFDVTANGLPREVVITNNLYGPPTTNEALDTNVPFTGTAGDPSRLADADGDGIPDSRWVWAPIPSKDGIYYMYAVRIVDLNSLINVNTATGLRNNDPSGSFDPTINAPRWRSPADLDLVKAIGDADQDTNFDPAFVGELENLLGYRGFSLVGGSLVPAAERWDHWINQGGTPYQNLSVANEFDLRFRHGLNSPDILATQIDAPGVGFETMMHGATYQQDNQDFTDPPWNGTVGGGGEQDYMEDNPRLRFTTLSAVRNLAPTNNFEYTIPRYQFNLNQPDLVAGGYGAAQEDLRDEILRSYGYNLDTTAFPVYRDYMAANPTIGTTSYQHPMLPATISGTYPPTGPQIIAFADQFIANLADYRDEDSRLTVHPGDDGAAGTADDVSGLEALPFIAEVYVQRAYKLDVDNASSLPQPPGGPTYSLRWTAYNNTTANTLPKSAPGFAIEIRNPFRRPITLEDVYLHVDYDDPLTAWDEGEEPWGDPAVGNTLDGTPDADRDLASIAGAALAAFNSTAYGVTTDDPNTPYNETQMLHPGDTIVLYRNGTQPDGVTAAPDDLVTPTMFTPSTTPGSAVLGVLLPPDTTGGAINTWPVVESNHQLPTPAPGSGTPPYLLKTVSDWVHIELRATNQDGTVLTWPYVRAPSRLSPDEYYQEGVTTFQNGLVSDPTTYVPGDTVIGYLQYGSTGNGSGINTMLMDEGLLPAADDATFTASTDFVQTIAEPNTPMQTDAVAGASVTSVEALGEEDKTVAPLNGPANVLDPTQNQIIIADYPGTVPGPAPDNDGSLLPYVGDLAHVVVLGPKPEVTAGPVASRSVASIFGDATANLMTLGSQTWEGTGTPQEGGIRKLMLDFDNTRTPTAANGQWPSPLAMDASSRNIGYPGATDYMTHAAFLMSRLTTLYAQDIGGTISDLDTVPGMVNLNTMPRELLELVLPITDDALRAAVADEIVTFRENSSATKLPGIRHPWQLFPVLRPLLRSNGTHGTFLGETAVVGATQVDFLSNPTAGTVDGIVDDREEEALLMKWLSQVATTRSDRFIAYVVVRGYRADNWAEPVESARFFQVFDRANDATGAPIDWEAAPETLPAYPDAWMYRY